MRLLHPRVIAEHLVSRPSAAITASILLARFSLVPFLQSGPTVCIPIHPTGGGWSRELRLNFLTKLGKPSLGGLDAVLGALRLSLIY